MMRKISCKLWAYNKNNSNSNMMIFVQNNSSQEGPLTAGMAPFSWPGYTFREARHS